MPKSAFCYLRAAVPRVCSSTEYGISPGREIWRTVGKFLISIFFVWKIYFPHTKKNRGEKFPNHSPYLATRRYLHSVTVSTTGSKLQDLLAAEHPTNQQESLSSIAIDQDHQQFSNTHCPETRPTLSPRLRLP